MQFGVPGLHAINSTPLLAAEVASTPIGHAEALIAPPIKKRPATVRTLMQTNNFFMPVSLSKNLKSHKLACEHAVRE
jgi:hypothetical protein